MKNSKSAFNAPFDECSGDFFLLGVPVGRSGFTFQVLA